MEKEPSQTKIEYEQLIGFAKSLSRFVIGAIAFIGSIVVFFTYQNAKDLKDEFRAQAERLEVRSEKLDGLRQEAFNQKLKLAQDQVDAIYRNAQREIEFVEKKALGYAEDEIRRKTEAVLTASRIEDITSNVVLNRIEPEIEKAIEKNLAPVYREMNAAQQVGYLIDMLHSGEDWAVGELIDSSYMSTSAEMRSISMNEVIKYLGVQLDQGGVYDEVKDNDFSQAIYSSGIPSQHDCASIPDEVLRKFTLVFIDPSEAMGVGYDTVALKSWYRNYKILPYDFTCYTQRFGVVNPKNN